MTNRNSMKQSYDCILSADGKAFSYTEILNLIRSMANYFANKRGHSMNQDHIYDLVGLVEEKVAEQFSVKYDSTRGPVKPWISRIVFNEGNDLLHDIIRRKEVYADYESEIKGERYSGSTDDELNLSELESKWQSYLGTLEGDKRNIMQWTRDGLKPAEIAQELGITPERVYQVLCKERKNLTKLFNYR